MQLMLKCSSASRKGVPGMAGGRRAAKRQVAYAHKVQFKTLDGVTTDLDVEEGDSILDAILDAGLDTSFDCRMGVCMTCPAKLMSGQVDQPNSMLSDDVRDEGYTLLCVATPLADCVINQITEEEILSKGLKDN